MQDVLYGIGLLFGIFLIYESGYFIYYGFRAHLSGKRASPISQHHPNPHKRVLIIGDSTSYGAGAIDPHNSLVGRLAKDFSNIEIVNDSENALSVAGVVQKLSQHTEQFDILMIHIGGIDTLSFTRFQKMEKFFVKMNNHIQRLKINTVILVTVNNVGLSPFICFPFKGIYSTRSKKMHHFFQKIAQIYSMVHISLYALPGNDPLAKNPSRLFAGDRIHPNDEGYGIWYSKIKEVIPTYLV